VAVLVLADDVDPLLPRAGLLLAEDVEEMLALRLRHDGNRPAQHFVRGPAEQSFRPPDSTRVCRFAVDRDDR
jgi:hypothetical protein